jgi:DNA gyrase/topoisomerase IV subunit A
MAEISDLLDLLAKPERVTSVIESELKEVQSEFGIAGGDTGRRSFIEMNATELFTEDLITPQDMVVTLSHTGYMKSQPLSEYRAQKRGGRGKQAATTKDEDWIDTLFVANTHDTILCFSDRGRMYWLKVWEVPQGSRTSRGKPIVNMFPLIEGEKITVILPIKGYQDDQYVFMSTRRGTVKKTRLSDFSNPRKAGIIAVDLDEGDFLVGAAITDGKHDVMLFSDAGKAVRFDENDVRPMGRTARGVRGMNLAEGQEVIAIQGLQIRGVHIAQGRPREVTRRDQFIANDINSFRELEQRGPVSIAPERCDVQVTRGTAQQPRVPMRFEHIEVAVLGYMILQQLEAVAVDRPDEHLGQTALEAIAHRFGDALDDAVLELRSGFLGECEGDDGTGIHAFADQRGDPPRYSLRLARAGAGDDLEVAASMINNFLLWLGEGDGRERWHPNRL